jgi:hypothetical protein
VDVVPTHVRASRPRGDARLRGNFSLVSPSAQ